LEAAAAVQVLAVRLLSLRQQAQVATVLHH
jgi:hypothetical protein